MTADLTWSCSHLPVDTQPAQQETCRPSGRRWPTHCVLVDTPDRQAAVGYQLPAGLGAALGPTGLHDFFPTTRFSEEAYLDPGSSSSPSPPGDIDYVVLSHLHFDHAGNVQALQETNARLVCSAKEKEWGLRLRRAVQRGSPQGRLRRPELRDRRRRR